MDEAQYWAWSRELAFGYFSKPPLLAWIIAGTDHGLRQRRSLRAGGLAAICTSPPRLIVYAMAEELYDERTAAWSALVYGFGPGVIFSTRIISTDVPLLLCLDASLGWPTSSCGGPDRRWSADARRGARAGMLAKYAMIYFLLCVPARRALIAMPDAAAGVAENFGRRWRSPACCSFRTCVWNAVNDFVTLRHTGDNIAAAI